MKRSPISSLLYWAVVVIGILGFGRLAFGGAIILYDTSPDSTVSGALIQSDASFTATQAATDFIKLFGGATIMNTGANTGDGVFRIELTGLANVFRNERLLAYYDFTTTRTGSNTGTVTYTLSTTANGNGFGFPVILNASSGDTVTSGTQLHTGFMQSNASQYGPGSASCPYTFFLEIAWTDGTAGDTLTLDIPRNSIDFQLSVPVPSSAGFLAIGVPFLGWRRRRG